MKKYVGFSPCTGWSGAKAQGKMMLFGTAEAVP
jgi:hypothetical protein